MAISGGVSAIRVMRGKQQVEGGALIWVVLGPEAPTMRGDDRSADREAQPEPVLLRRVERIEHAIFAAVRQPDPAVADQDLEVLAVEWRDLQLEAARRRRHQVHRLAP